MRHILIIFLLAFSLTSYGQSTPPPASRGSDNVTQVDRFITALKRLGIPTAATDTLSPALQLTDAENSAKLLFNTTSQKLRLYIPGSGWRDATPINLTNYYTKSQVDSLLSELPTGASNLSISSRTDTTVIIGNSNGTGVTIPPVNTSQAGVMPASYKTKLDSIESGAQVNTVIDVAGKTGSVELTKDDIDGLDQVDNTSDEDKPVSNATKDSLALKEPAFSKNTAFNKDFGTTSGTVAQGNDSRINNGQTAFGWGNHSGLYVPIGTGAGASVSESASDLNNVYTTLRYANGASNRPASINGHMISMRVNANYGAQIYSHYIGEDWFLRKLIAGTWGEWRTLYHSGNFNPSNYLPTSQKGAANGLATLDGSGKIPLTQIPTSIPYQGTWDASTNTPTLADGAGTAGFYYRVSVSGSQNLGSGTISFSVGDDVIYNGSIWQRAPGGATATNLSLGSVTDTSIVINNSNGTGVTIPAVTGSNAGLMTAADKDKIDEAVTEETDPTVPDEVKSITSGDISSWNDKEPSFAKNTAFNKDFGTTSGTVAQGNDSRINNGQTAFGWGNHSGLYLPLGTGVGTSASEASADLNTVYTSVRYAASGASNRPETMNGHMLSMRVNENYAAQFYAHASGEGWFLRKLVAGTWGSWRTIYHSGNFNPSNYVPTTRTITVNGTPYALSSNISFTTPNTTYTAGTGLTLTGTEFTPTFGTTSGTVAQGNHTHDTATVSLSGFMTPYDKARIAAFSTDGLATLGTSQTFTAAKTFNGASANLTMDEGSGGASPFIYFRNTNNSINGDTTSMYYNSGTAGHVMRVNGTARLTTTSSGITVNGDISGGGSGITGLNGSNISTGTIPFARLPVGTSSSTVAVGNHTHAFSAITSTPTTLSGYGITDAVTTNTTQVISGQKSFNGASANILMNERATGLSPYIYFRNSDNSISGTNTGMVLAAGSGGYTFAVSGANRLTVNSTGIAVNGAITGSGSGITGLDADNISSGTIGAARLPIASAGTLGAIKVGTGLSIDSSGTLSTTGSGSADLKLRTAGSADTGSVRYAGTTRTPGQFYGGTTNPVAVTRLNYDGTLHTGGGVVTPGVVTGKRFSTTPAYSIDPDSTVISWDNGSTQRADIAGDRTYTVDMANGQALDVEINNNSGTVMTISFIGATLPEGMDGTIPIGGVAVFSFKHFGGANARVTKVIF